MLRPLCSMLLAVCALVAQDWFVAGSGDDARDGRSPEQAFRTLARAAKAVAPGDTVLIGDGTYANADPAGAVLELAISGTPTAWIVWQARAGQHPELRPTGWSGIDIKASYQRIEGLTVIGGNDSLTLVDALADEQKDKPDARYNTNGISVDGRKLNAKPHHITIHGCTVRKCPGGGISAIESDHITVEDCRVSENAWYMRYGGSGISTLNGWTCDDDPGYHIVIRRNLVWGNRTLVPWKRIGKHSDGNGIILDVTDLGDGATNPDADPATAATAPAGDRRPAWTGRSLVANNISCGNGGSGIHAFRTRRVDIINNTTVGNGGVVGYPEVFANSCDEVRILNNIVIPRPGAKATSNHKNTHLLWDYNLYPWGAGDPHGEHDLLVDPQLVDPGTDLLHADLHPVAGSPAVGSGCDEVLQTDDLDGAARPGASRVTRGALLPRR